MILFKTKPDVEKMIVFESMGHRAWRTVVALTWCSFDVFTEMKSHFNTPAESKWRMITTNYFNITINKHFCLGPSHMYYDGPHCGFSLGWLHINWSYGWCNKCMPDEV